MPPPGDPLLTDTEPCPLAGTASSSRRTGCRQRTYLSSRTTGVLVSRGDRPQADPANKAGWLRRYFPATRTAWARQWVRVAPMPAPVIPLPSLVSAAATAEAARPPEALVHHEAVLRCRTPPTQAALWMMVVPIVVDLSSGRS